MLDYDLTRSTFRYVESLWFRYNDMIDRLRDIEAEEKRLGIYKEEDSLEGIRCDVRATYTEGKRGLVDEEGSKGLKNAADHKVSQNTSGNEALKSAVDGKGLQSVSFNGGLQNVSGNEGLQNAAVVGAVDVEELLSKSTLATQKQKEVIKRNVLAIDTVYSNLPEEYKKVADVRYFKRRNRYNKQAPSWEEVSRRSNYSRRHAMRIRDKMVRDTAMLLGLW